jgi:hypothetical protein
MKMQPLVFTLASICAACALGCSDDSSDRRPPVESGRFDTEEITADILVEARAPGRFDVDVEMRHSGRGRDVVLSDGDSFLAIAPDGQEETLRRRVFLGGAGRPPRYGADFETSPAEGEVRVRFRGTPLDVDLRPEFSVTSPAPGQLFGFQDDLPITWTPAEPGATMRISIRIICSGTTVDTISSTPVHEVADTGSFDYDLSLNPLATDPRVDTSKDCSLEVRLFRDATTDISPPFSEPSALESIQWRSVDQMHVTF